MVASVRGPDRARPRRAALLLTALVAALPVSLQPQTVRHTESGVAFASTGRGPAVVLIHGFALDRRMWHEQVRVLEDRFTVLLPDARGHGASPVTQDPYAAHDDVVAVMDAAGVDRAVLVGLSSGAGIAVDVALRYPTRVRGLVLAAPTVGGYRPQGSFEWMDPVIEAARAGNADLAAKRFAETALMDVSAKEAAVELTRRMILDNRRLWTLASNPQRSLDPPAIDRLGELLVPTLVIVGARDTDDTHAVASLLVDQLEDVELREVSGVGHLVSLAAPDVFNRLLLEFLDSLPSSDGRDRQ